MIYGKDYGIILERGFWEKVLSNIPLINRLYTVKVALDVTGFTGHAPCEGTFKYFRIIRPFRDRLRKRTICFLYALPHTYSEIRAYVRFNDGEENQCVQVCVEGGAVACQWQHSFFWYTFTKYFSPIERKE